MSTWPSTGMPSHTSARTTVNRGWASSDATFSRDPVTSESTQTTVAPSPTSRSQSQEPRKPAPPVTTIRAPSASATTSDARGGADAAAHLLQPDGAQHDHADREHEVQPVVGGVQRHEVRAAPLVDHEPVDPEHGVHESADQEV